MEGPGIDSFRGEAAILEFGANYPDKQKNDPAATLVQEKNGSSRRLPDGYMPPVEEVEYEVQKDRQPADRLSPEARYGMKASVDDLTGFLKGAGLKTDEAYEKMLSDVQKENLNRSQKEAAYKEAEKLARELYEGLKKAEEARKSNDKEAFLKETKAIGNLIEAGVSNMDVKLMNGNYLLKGLRIIALDKDPTDTNGEKFMSELREKAKNGGIVAALKEEIKAYADRATASIFGPDSSRLQDKRSEIAKNIADMEGMLRNPGTKTAAEVYQLGAKDANGDMLRPVERAIAVAISNTREKKAEDERGRDEIDRMLREKDYANILLPRADVEKWLSDTNKLINQLRTETIPYLQGEIKKANGNAKWLSFVQELLALSEQRLALENTRLPMLKNQKLAWDAKDKGTFFQTPQEILNERKNVLINEIPYLDRTIKMLKASLTVDVPDYENKVPIFKDRQAVRSYWHEDDKEPRTAKVMGRLSRIEENRKYLKIAAENKKMFFEGTRNLITQWLPTLDQEKEYHDNPAWGVHRQADLDDKYVESKGTSETPTQVIERKLKLAREEFKIVQERIRIVDAVNQLVATGKYFADGVGESVKNIMDIEEKNLLKAVDTIDALTGAGKNPLEDVLKSLGTSNETNQTRLRENKVVKEAGKALDDAKTKAKKALAELAGASSDYNRRVLLLTDHLMKINLEKAGIQEFTADRFNALRSYVARMTPGPAGGCPNRRRVLRLRQALRAAWPHSTEGLSQRLLR